MTDEVTLFFGKDTSESRLANIPCTCTAKSQSPFFCFDNIMQDGLRVLTYDRWIYRNQKNVGVYFLVY